MGPPSATAVISISDCSKLIIVGVMAVDQVKRFQHLQEQRTQAFHELGIILFWYYPFLSKS